MPSRGCRRSIEVHLSKLSLAGAVNGATVICQGVANDLVQSSFFSEDELLSSRVGQSCRPKVLCRCPRRANVNVRFDGLDLRPKLRWMGKTTSNQLNYWLELQILA